MAYRVEVGRQARATTRRELCASTEFNTDQKCTVTSSRFTNVCLEPANRRGSAVRSLQAERENPPERPYT
jgi:hypothetical protein